MVYHLYGVRLRSAWALPYRRATQPDGADIVLSRRGAGFFSAARAETALQPRSPGRVIEGLLADGGVYLRWPDRFEFLISPDGRQIGARPLPGGTLEGFHTYLLGQVLSFALIKLRLDPLHATVVTVDGGAAAFLGESGFGKSSLAAAFIAAGHRLVTDDLLVVTDGPGGPTAHPGPPRLKLFPLSARRILPDARGARIMRSTPKLLFPLDAAQTASSPLGLRALYVLAPPAARRTAATRVTIRRLSERHACLALIRNTFNASLRDRARLARQFALSARLAGSLAVKSLSYPRSFAALADVRAAILADLRRDMDAGAA